MRDRVVIIGALFHTTSTGAIKKTATSTRYITPMFCGLAAPTMDAMQILWNLVDPDEKAKEAAKANAKGGAAKRTAKRRAASTRMAAKRVAAKESASSSSTSSSSDSD